MFIQKLFKRVVPHHCLGCIWSQRDKEENKQLAATVRATIAQFNAVTKCVVRTVLNGKELKVQQRAKIIEKWINVAHVNNTDLDLFASLVFPIKNSVCVCYKICKCNKFLPLLPVHAPPL